MIKVDYDKYNTPFQKLLKEKYGSEINANSGDFEESEKYLKFLFLLAACEQYEVENEMLEYVNNHPDATIDDLDAYFDKIAPLGLPPCASEWEDDDDDEDNE